MTKLLKLIQKVVGDDTLEIFETKHNLPGLFMDTEWGTNVSFRLQGINLEKNTRTIVDVTFILESFKLDINVVRFTCNHAVLTGRENIIIYLRD